MFQVLCLDECTANIDIQTASIIQNVITSECQGMTIITIAHRISTVLSMDNILVLEKGTVVCSPLLISSLVYTSLYSCILSCNLKLYFIRLQSPHTN